MAGALALAGRLLPFPARTGRGPTRHGGTRGPSPTREPAHRGTTRGISSPVVEIEMRASDDGAHVWFDPVGLLVRPGTTVRWVLREGVHTATAYHPANGDFPRRIPKAARPWDSGYLVEPGSTYEVPLHVPGVYDFLCRPHEAAGMVGRIVVATSTAVGGPREGPGEAPPPRAAPPGIPAAPPGEDGLPPAAARAFPAVGAILREGAVRLTETPDEPPP